MAEPLRVFVFGSARSGTSITYFALREVFGLKGHGESHVFPIFMKMLHQFFMYRNEFAEQANPLARQLNVVMLRDSFHAYIREFYGRVYPGGRFVDKTPGPGGIRSCEMVLGAFPDAKIILLQRNAIEVVNSHRKKFGSEFETACQAWTQVALAAREMIAAHPEILVIDQFDLTNAPEDVAGRICNHLGMPGVSGKLATFFADRRVEQQSAHDWTRRLVLADVDWTEDQKLLFRMICGDQMEAIGYAM